MNYLKLLLIIQMQLIWLLMIGNAFFMNNYTNKLAMLSL